MAQYSGLEVANVMEETGMAPLFYHPDFELRKKLLKRMTVKSLRNIKNTLAIIPCLKNKM